MTSSVGLEAVHKLLFPWTILHQFWDSSLNDVSYSKITCSFQFYLTWTDSHNLQSKVWCPTWEGTIWQTDCWFLVDDDIWSLCTIGIWDHLLIFFILWLFMWYFSFTMVEVSLCWSYASGSGLWLWTCRRQQAFFEMKNKMTNYAWISIYFYVFICLPHLAILPVEVMRHVSLVIKLCFILF